MRLLLAISCALFSMSVGAQSVDTLTGEWICMKTEGRGDNNILATFWVDGKLHHVRDNVHYPSYFLLAGNPGDTRHKYYRFTRTNQDSIITYRDTDMARFKNGILGSVDTK